MGIQVYETPESPTLSDDSAERRYKIEGTLNELMARTALLWASPVLFANGTRTLVRQTARVEPDDVDVWNGIVAYGEQKRPETGDSTYQFDTGGGTQHITHSIKTVGKYAPPGKTAPDFKGAIGVTLDNVEGVDITVPVYHFSETHYLAAAMVTGAYKAAVYRLTGKMKGGPFRGFAKGEVLFCGAAGSKRGEEDWEVTFKWAASENATDIKIGNITVPSKEGWAYLWVRYRDTDDQAAKELVKEPIGAYVEQVYEYGDFSGLGIGV